MRDPRELTRNALAWLRNRDPEQRHLRWAILTHLDGRINFTAVQLVTQQLELTLHRLQQPQHLLPLVLLDRGQHPLVVLLELQQCLGIQPLLPWIRVLVRGPLPQDLDNLALLLHRHRVPEQ